MAAPRCRLGNHFPETRAFVIGPNIFHSRDMRGDEQIIQGDKVSFDLRICPISSIRNMVLLGTTPPGTHQHAGVHAYSINTALVGTKR